MPRRSFFKARDAARALSFAVHDAADELDARRSPGLRNQLLRAAASVPANIAEGEQQSSDAQAIHFLRIALGSADEVGAHLDQQAQVVPRRQLRGGIDEVAFYGAVLSHSQIASHFSTAGSAVPGAYHNLVLSNGARLLLSNNGVIPEPSSAALLAIGALALGRRRR